MTEKRFYDDRFGYGTIIREGINDFTVLFDSDPWFPKTYYKKQNQEKKRKFPHNSENYLVNKA